MEQTPQINFKQILFIGASPASGNLSSPGLGIYDRVSFGIDHLTRRWWVLVTTTFTLRKTTHRSRTATSWAMPTDAMRNVIEISDSL